MKEKNSLLLIPKGRRPGIPQKKDAAPAQFSATWTECYEIQFHQPNKIVVGLIQSDIHHQMAANIGIDRFPVVCLVAWPLNESEARVDLALIETSLLFLC